MIYYNSFSNFSIVYCINDRFIANEVTKIKIILSCYSRIFIYCMFKNIYEGGSDSFLMKDHISNNYNKKQLFIN